MTLSERIEAVVAPTLEAMGFAVVRILVSGKERRRLQIMVERTDGEGVVLDDCAAISRALSPVLDVEDPIEGAYALEISSPGIDRPLVKAADFERFAGREARIELARPIDGRRRFVGQLLGLAEDRVRLSLDGAEIALPLADVQRAKLTANDR